MPIINLVDPKIRDSIRWFGGFVFVRIEKPSPAEDGASSFGGDTVLAMLKFE